MSRSNVQIATELRKDEALQTRKRILKCGASVRKQHAVAQQLANSDDVYLQKLEKLKKFSKDKKEVKKKLSQQSEWIQGGFYLINHALRIEAELPTMYQRLLISMLQERNTSFTEVSELKESNEESRKQNQSFAMLQLHEIKGMLSNVKKHYRNYAGDTSEEVENKRQHIAAVLANLIVQMRASHNSVWEALSSEENSLNLQLNETIVGFCKMQREYRQFYEDSRLEDELQTLDSDNEKILTLVEEWKQKVYDLEGEHAQVLQALACERASLQPEHQGRRGGGDGGEGGGLDKVEEAGCAGWDERSHKIFVKVVKRAQVQGLSRHILSSTLAAELPDKSAQDISAHEDWYTAMMSVHDRKKKAVLSYTSRREELLKEASESLAGARTKAVAEAAALEEQRAHEKARALMHLQLNQQRAERVNEMQSRLIEIERLKLQVILVLCSASCQASHMSHHVSYVCHWSIE